MGDETQVEYALTGPGGGKKKKDTSRGVKVEDERKDSRKRHGGKRVGLCARSGKIHGRSPPDRRGDDVKKKNGDAEGEEHQGERRESELRVIGKNLAWTQKELKKRQACENATRHEAGGGTERERGRRNARKKAKVH